MIFLFIRRKCTVNKMFANRGPNIISVHFQTCLLFVNTVKKDRILQVVNVQKLLYTTDMMCFVIKC